MLKVQWCRGYRMYEKYNDIEDIKYNMKTSVILRISNIIWKVKWICGYQDKYEKTGMPRISSIILKMKWCKGYQK